MILHYGSFQFDQAEAAITSLRKRPVFSPKGIRIATRETWDVEGTIIADSVTAVTTAIDARISALSTNDQTVKLTEDDGTTETSHKIDTANTIGGVRVAGFDFPQGGKQEYVTTRTWRATFEADVIDDDQDLLDYQDALATIGTTGPRNIIKEVLTGPPQKQLVNQATMQTVIQSGYALGFRTYPTPASPMFPAAERLDLRRVTRRTPERRGAGTNSFDRNFRIEWQYTFESNVPLFALPVPA